MFSANATGYSVLALILVAAVITLSILLFKKSSSKTTLVIPDSTTVTQMPGGSAALTLPPDMSTANLAYYLKLNEASTSGLALYGPAFKQAFMADNLVPAPDANTSLETLLQKCQTAYGNEGTLVAEAAEIAFVNHTNRDMLA